MPDSPLQMQRPPGVVRYNEKGGVNCLTFLTPLLSVKIPVPNQIVSTTVLELPLAVTAIQARGYCIPSFKSFCT